MFKKSGKKSKKTEEKNTGLKGATKIPNWVKDKYIKLLLRKRAKDYHKKVLAFRTQNKKL